MQPGSEILSDPHSQRYLWNLMINNVEDIVVFLGFKVINSDNS